MLKQDPTPERPGAAVESLTELTLAVFRLNGLLLQWGDRLVGPIGLTSSRWQMLGALALRGKPLTSPQVGDVMGVSRQGAQKQLHALEALGLVEPQANPAHKRSPLYALTPQGRRLYGRAEQLWAQRATELAAAIPPSRATAAAATLKAMSALLGDLSQTSEGPE